MGLPPEPDSIPNNLTTGIVRLVGAKTKKTEPEPVVGHDTGPGFCFEPWTHNSCPGSYLAAQIAHDLAFQGSFFMMTPLIQVYLLCG